MHRWLVAVVVVALTLSALAQDRGGGPPRAAARGPQARPRRVPLHVRRPAMGSKWAAGGPASTIPRNREPDSSSSRWARLSARPRARRSFCSTPNEDWEGPYTTKATLTMTKLASHQVAYGLFVGGQDLDTDKQRYTYFVIRQDGKYRSASAPGRRWRTWQATGRITRPYKSPMPAAVRPMNWRSRSAETLSRSWRMARR